MKAARTLGLAWATALCLPVHARAASQGEARPLVVALEYGAVPECPDLSEFKAVVNGRLGYDPFREGVPNRVFVQIMPQGPAYEGRIEWRDAEGRWAGDRSFPSRSADCRDLARAMAFALALQIQLSAGPGAPAASGAPPAEPARAADATAPPPAPPASPPPENQQPDVPAATQVEGAEVRRSRPTLAIGGGALLGFGMSPRPVPFGRLFGSVAWPRWSVELAAEVGWPSTVRRADGAGFSQQELLLGVAGCGSHASWSACLLAKGGAIRIEGKTIDVPASPTGPLFETGLRLAAIKPLGGRLYVRAKAEGLLLVTRWRVTLDDHVVWTSPRFAGTIGLDLGIRFP